MRNVSTFALYSYYIWHLCCWKTLIVLLYFFVLSYWWWCCLGWVYECWLPL